MVNFMVISQKIKQLYNMVSGDLIISLYKMEGSDFSESKQRLTSMDSKAPPRIEIQIHETEIFGVIAPPPDNFEDLQKELSAFLECQSQSPIANYRLAYTFSSETEASIFSESSY